MAVKCLICNKKYESIESVYTHMNREHADSIPRNFSASRAYYALRTGKDKGSCIICHMDTQWNETTHKYNRFCDMPKCKDKYREEFKKRMIGKHGKIHLLKDPEHQKKMLANRSISGKYKWSDGSKEIVYTGNYELDFLKFLDVLMDLSSDDIMAPSPHTYVYDYKGEEKFYIPDFFIPSLNLEVEIKTGGDNPNNHPNMQGIDKAKEKLKDRVLLSQREFSYVKITDKNYEPMFTFLTKSKEEFAKSSRTHKASPIFVIGESANTNNGDVVTADSIRESLEWNSVKTLTDALLDEEEYTESPMESVQNMIKEFCIEVGVDYDNDQALLESYNSLSDFSLENVDESVVSALWESLKKLSENVLKALVWMWKQVVNLFSAMWRKLKSLFGFSGDRATAKKPPEIKFSYPAITSRHAEMREVRVHSIQELKPHADAFSRDVNSSVQQLLSQQMNLSKREDRLITEFSRSHVTEAKILHGKEVQFSQTTRKTMGGDSSPRVSGSYGDISEGDMHKRLEKFDVEMHKKILASTDVVSAYNEYVNFEITKIKNRAHNDEATALDGLVIGMCGALNELGLSDDQIRKEIRETSFIKSQDPVVLRKILSLRVNYNKRLISLLENVVRKGQSIFGMTAQEIDSIVSKLHGSGEGQSHSIIAIKNALDQNKSKFVKGNGVLDLRPLGAGVIFMTTHDVGNVEHLTSLSNLIQESLRYDAIVVAHGNTAQVSNSSSSSSEDLKGKLAHLEDELEKLEEQTRASRKEADALSDKLHQLRLDVVDKKISPEQADPMKKELNASLEKADRRTNELEEKEELLQNKIYELEDEINDNKHSVSTKHAWVMQPVSTLHSGTFGIMDDLIVALIKEGFKRILIISCNPGHHHLSPEIQNTKGVIIRHSMNTLVGESSLEVIDESSKESLTNFPTKGDNKEITLKNSRRPEFDRSYAEKLKEEYPSIWDKGGNIRGNDAYKYWGMARKGQMTKEVISWIKEREAWGARHAVDIRLAGIVANIKWGTIVSKGQKYMKEVIEEAKGKIDKKSVKESSVEILEESDMVVMKKQYPGVVISAMRDINEGEKIDWAFKKKGNKVTGNFFKDYDGSAVATCSRYGFKGRGNVGLKKVDSDTEEYDLICIKPIKKGELILPDWDQYRDLFGKVYDIFESAVGLTGTAVTDSVTEGSLVLGQEFNVSQYQIPAKFYKKLIIAMIVLKKTFGKEYLFSEYHAGPSLTGDLMYVSGSNISALYKTNLRVFTIEMILDRKVEEEYLKKAESYDALYSDEIAKWKKVFLSLKYTVTSDNEDVIIMRSVNMNEMTVELNKSHIPPTVTISYNPSIIPMAITAPNEFSKIALSILKDISKSVENKRTIVEKSSEDRWVTILAKGTSAEPSSRYRMRVYPDKKKNTAKQIASYLGLNGINMVNHTGNKYEMVHSEYKFIKIKIEDAGTYTIVTVFADKRALDESAQSIEVSAIHEDGKCDLCGTKLTDSDQCSECGWKRLTR